MLPVRANSATSQPGRRSTTLMETLITTFTAQAEHQKCKHFAHLHCGAAAAYTAQTRTLNLLQQKDEPIRMQYLQRHTPG
jgi:hypothetical protein